MSDEQTAGSEIVIRPMNLSDLDAILSIDRKIRATGEAVTYAKLTTEHIFAIDRKSKRQARPTGYADLITEDVRGLLELSSVAEVDGHVRGFILGDIAHIGEAATETGTILIVGVHPEYQRRSIATKLVNALAEKYRSKGINKIRLGINTRDKGLVTFAEHMGFSPGHLVVYSKAL